MRVPGMALARRPGWPIVPAGPPCRQAPARPAAAAPALADAAGAELHADPGAGGPRGLGDGMFPGALAAAAHHQQVAMAEAVAERGTATARCAAAGRTARRTPPASPAGRRPRPRGQGHSGAPTPPAGRTPPGPPGRAASPGTHHLPWHEYRACSNWYSRVAAGGG